jgi:uncharacterized membrane protein
MAKKTNSHQIARQGNNHVIQTSYEEDDNMMPSPDLLAQYNQLDPSFIEWFKNRADLEQNARIKFNDDRIKLANSTDKKLYRIDLTSIFVSAIILLAGLALSAYLIYHRNFNTGSILGGGTILAYVIRLLNFRKKDVNSGK